MSLPTKRFSSWTHEECAHLKWLIKLDVPIEWCYAHKHDQSWMPIRNKNVDEYSVALHLRIKPREPIS